MHLWNGFENKTRGIIRTKSRLLVNEGECLAWKIARTNTPGGRVCTRTVVVDSKSRRTSTRTVHTKAQNNKRGTSWTTETQRCCGEVERALICALAKQHVGKCAGWLLGDGDQERTHRPTSTQHLTHIAQASPIPRVTNPLHLETNSITLVFSRPSLSWWWVVFVREGRGANFET